MRVLIIPNPSMGINREKRTIIDRVASLIRDRDGTVDIAYSYKRGHGKKIAAMATMEGYDAVYAAGGDGTVNDVASGLVESGIPLGIIPLGTGNGLARGLHIPLDPDGYIDVLMKNNTIAVDAGKIGSNLFFATAGIGYDSNIAYDFDQKFKSQRSIPRYFYIGVKNYFMNRPEKVTLVVDGKEIQRKIFVLTVANTSQYGGGAVIDPHADPTDGKLTVIIIPKLGILKTLFAVRKLFEGTIYSSKDIEFHEFNSLKIIREKPGLFQVDGEAYEGTARMNVTVLPGALTVLAPPWESRSI
jgi:diacylglycerol kinase (ATP)